MNEILNLINSMAPFLLLGFFLAGLMHAFVPGRLYQQHLGKSNFKSVLYATLIAIPLPLCSCGVIPTAMSLRKEGASKGSVISFLIATPQTGVDSILATYSMMGLPFAIVRPIAALVTALFGGTLANSAENKLGGGSTDAVSVANDYSGLNFWGKMKVALKYSFYEMMQDIGKWLAVGLVIAGLITIYVPDEFFAQFSDNSMLSILIVLLFAIPMYLCATGSIPIAIALMLKGLTPGAALVMLMAGPAVNMASILVIHKVMGWRTLFVYLLSIISGSIIFALIIDSFPREVFIGPLEANSAAHCEGTPLFNWICSGVLFLLLANALFRRFFVSKKACSCQEGACAISQGAASTCGYVLSIEGMKCNHCSANVEKALRGIEGVIDVVTDLASGTAVVNGEFDVKDASAAVEDLGFKVVKTDSLAKGVARHVFKIEGMKCNHCSANVEKALNGIEGAKNVATDLAAGIAMAEGEFDTAAAVEAIESLGFKVSASGVE